jgi:hypothetical protein
MKSLACFVLSLVISAAAVLTTSAETLANGSFETDLTAWTATGNVAMANRASAPYVPTDGSKLIAFNAGNSLPNGALTQVFATDPRQLYVLEFDVGAIAYNKNEQRLQVSVTGTASLVSDTVPVFGLGGGATRWVAKRFAFVADSAITTLAFSDLSAATLNEDLLVDHVRITPQLGFNLIDIDPQPSPLVNYGGPTPTMPPLPDSPAIDAAGNPSDAPATDQRGYPRIFGPAMDIGAVEIQQTVVRPVVVISPTSVTTLVGSSVTFRVQATGTGPLVYQWRHNHDDIPSATSSEYTIDPVQEDSAGLYDVVVSNAAGSAMSDLVSLTVIVAPQILANGSFEADLVSWSASGNVGIADPAGAPYVPTDGSKLVAFNAGNSVPNGVLTQNVPTVASRRYVLEFDAGVIAYNKYEQRLQVSITGGAALLSDSVSIFGLGNGATRWVAKRYEFVADSSLSTLTFRDRSPATLNLDLLLDHVRITPLPAEVLTVTTLADENDGALGHGSGDSLREVLAVSAKVIRFAPALNGGTILLGGSQLRVDANTTIDASALAHGITVSGNHASRVFSVSNQAVVEMTGLVSNQAVVEMRGLVITAGTTPGDGGGILNGNNCNLTLIDSTLRGNTSSGSGGAISTAGDGSGTGSWLALTNCALTDNQAADSGGGILNNGWSLTVTGCTLSGNRAATGGGIRNGAGNLFITDTTVAGNSAEGNGGGIVSYNYFWHHYDYDRGSNLYVTNSTFAGNTAGDVGGAFFTYDNDALTLVAQNVTISGNSAGTAGGGVAGGGVALRDSIVAGNSSATDPNISVFSLHNNGHNLIDIDPQLFPLGNYGGPTPTMPPLPGSPAIDAAGNPSDAPATDQRGLPRISGPAMDIGAVEIQPVAIILANGSFEADLTGWAAGGNVGIADPTGAPYVPTDGSKIIAFNSGQSTPNGVLSQVFATVPGQTYTLAFDAGVIAYNKNPQTLQVSVTGSLLSQTISINGLGGGATRWVPMCFSFVANGATSTLTFRDQSASTNNIDLLLDHVRVTALVNAAALPVTPDQTPSAPAAAVTSTTTPSQPATIGTPVLSCTPAVSTISLSACQPGSYVLERSHDLKTWQYVSEMQLAWPGQVEFLDPTDSSAAGTPMDKMFYRIGRRP